MSWDQSNTNTDVNDCVTVSISDGIFKSKECVSAYSKVICQNTTTTNQQSTGIGSIK